MGKTLEKKNLIIRNDRGRVIEYFEDGAKDIDKYRWLETEEGCELEITADRYTRKWGKWWNQGPAEENKAE